MDKTTLESLAQDALEAFWELVAGRYPQAKTGDLSSRTTIQLVLVAEHAIAEWVDNNVPTPETP